MKDFIRFFFQITNGLPGSPCLRPNFLFCSSAPLQERNHWTQKVNNLHSRPYFVLVNQVKFFVQFESELEITLILFRIICRKCIIFTEPRTSTYLPEVSIVDQLFILQVNSFQNCEIKQYMSLLFYFNECPARTCPARMWERTKQMFHHPCVTDYLLSCKDLTHKTSYRPNFQWFQFLCSQCHVWRTECPC